MLRALIIISVLTAAILAAVCASTIAVPPGSGKKKDAGLPKPPEPNPLKLPTRKDAMQMKLKSMQTILEGIALDDFERIQTAAEQMVQVSNATDFLNAYKGMEYQFHVELMRRPAETISKKAKDRNIDGVMISYNELTLSCLKCHQAMRSKKFEILEWRDGTRGE